MATSFVPVTDEVWRLQRGTDAECKHFQAMANTGHFQQKGGTRQGIYVMTASGKRLASINHRNGKEVVEMMQRGLTAWATTSKADRALPDGFEMPRRRWETSFPQDGLVLRSMNIDMQASGERERRNRDHVWFSADEAKGWLGADLRKGATHAVSKTIIERLVCFHLVDNIYGQTLPFAPAEITTAELTTKVMDVQDDVVHFNIKGKTGAATDGTWRLGKSDWVPTEKYPRSVHTTVMGRGQFNTKTQRFTKLELVAVGPRSGRTNLNGRPVEDVGSRIGFFFEIAPNTAAARVPPAFIDIYDADWVVDPR